MQQVLFISALILSAAYAVFLIWCIYGWIALKGPGDVYENKSFKTRVSVIIPARNEAENIPGCLDDFLHQQYPADLFEVIVVDDHSTDHTAETVEKFISEHPGYDIRLIRMRNEEERKTFKKLAITEAVNAASGELILTTDADCRRGRRWIASMAGSYESGKPELISAPVVFTGEDSWLEKIQSLEFLGLISIGAAAIQNRMPFLCNGANLAFPKNIFVETGGYTSMKNISSGDDTQLLARIVSRGKGKVHFIKSGDATVFTGAQKTIRGLFNQRRRWASKIPVQMNSFTVFIAVIAYLLHAALLLSVISIIGSGNYYVYMIPLIIKMIPEFVLLMNVSVFFKKSKLLFLFLPAQVIYPVYIFVVGLLSLSGSYQWKGRQVQ